MLELANWKLDPAFKESATLQITLKNYFIGIVMSNYYVKENGDFLNGPVVRTCTFTAKGLGSIPGWGTKIPQVHSVAKKPPKRVISCKMLYQYFQSDFFERSPKFRLR